jgi:DNA-binding MarR family transcriptional regulator
MDLELSGPQYVLLRHLADTPESAPTGAHLANALGVSQASVGALLIDLEVRGFVYRAPGDEPGRLIRNAITTEGIDTCAQATARLTTAGDQLARLLTAQGHEGHDGDMHALLSLLTRLLSVLDQVTTSSEPSSTPLRRTRP